MHHQPPLATAGLAGLAALLAGCMTVSEEDGLPPERRPAGECSAEPVQQFVGQRATGELGQRLLQLSGATILRWVPPRTAVTMDFNPARLTVSYDDDMVIDRISCG